MYVMYWLVGYDTAFSTGAVMKRLQPALFSYIYARTHFNRINLNPNLIRSFQDRLIVIKLILVGYSFAWMSVLSIQLHKFH
jgi:hypothetical protein